MKEWKEFERLVAALHVADADHSSVKWNDIINGRQFDVSIRFSHGLHEYLTVIECRKERRRIEVSEVEAYVTKSRDVGANKAVIVSPVGFQQGCISVAQRHGIVLLTLEQGPCPDQIKPTDILIPAINVLDVAFIRPNGRHFKMPSGAGGILEYWMKRGRIQTPQWTMSPSRLLHEWQLGERPPISDVPVEVELPLGEKAQLFLPDRKSPVDVQHMKFTYKFIKARKSAEGQFDLQLQDRLAGQFTLTSVVDGKKSQLPFGKIRHGFDTELETGLFYENPVFGFYYYCRGIEGNLVDMVLIESYQNGSLIQCEFKFDKKYQRQYVPVKDTLVLRRLRARLRKLEKIRANQALQPTGKAGG